MNLGKKNFESGLEVLEILDIVAISMREEGNSKKNIGSIKVIGILSGAPPIKNFLK
jgi:hypothetical protein